MTYSLRVKLQNGYHECNSEYTESKYTGLFVLGVWASDICKIKCETHLGSTKSLVNHYLFRLPYPCTNTERISFPSGLAEMPSVEGNKLDM